MEALSIPDQDPDSIAETLWADAGDPEMDMPYDDADDDESMADFELDSPGVL